MVRLHVLHVYKAFKHWVPTQCINFIILKPLICSLKDLIVLICLLPWHFNFVVLWFENL